MRVLITGGAGNVGRGVAHRLMGEHEVVSFDLVQTPELECPQIVGNLLDLDALRAAMNGVDAVVHLGAIPHPMNDPADRVFEVNVMGTHRVADAATAAGVGRIVFASSDSTLGLCFGEYGLPLPVQYVPVDAAHPVIPRDPYGLSKKVGEEILEAFHRRHGTAITCLRYACVWWDATYETQPLHDANVANVAAGLWTYVDARDVADAIACALDRVDEGFHIIPLTAPDTTVSQPTIELVRKYLPPTVEIRERETFDTNPFRTLWTLRPCKDILGFEPTRSWRKR